MTLTDAAIIAACRESADALLAYAESPPIEDMGCIGNCGEPPTLISKGLPYCDDCWSLLPRLGVTP